MNYECPTEFNKITSFRDCNGWTKKLQESTDPLKYKFDVHTPPICFMPGKNFQGLQSVGGRMPPPQLMDMETTLRTMPLKEQENEYYISNIHQAKPPKMPDILSNRLVIPDCGDLLGYKTTKVKGRTDFPEWSERVNNMGRKNMNFMMPGEDTKATIKELYKKYEKDKIANNNVYGVSKFDDRPLKPGTNPKCNNADSDLDCMHVYGPDSTRDNTVLDSTMTLSDLAKRGLSITAKKDPTQRIGLVSSMGQSTPNSETRRVAETINPNIPYVDLLKPIHSKNACKTSQFYSYSPPSC